MDDVIKRILVDIATLDHSKKIKLLKVLKMCIAAECMKRGCDGCDACGQAKAEKRD